MAFRTEGIKKMKVFPKGQVVIPVSLRERYNIHIGDHVEVIPADNGILLKPAAKPEKAESLTDSLFGIFREYSLDNQSLDKVEITKVTETGFAEGWKR